MKRPSHAGSAAEKSIGTKAARHLGKRLPGTACAVVSGITSTVVKRAEDTTFDERSRGQVMAHALVERVTGRPADVPEPVALNLVMSDQAFPRVGPQFGRPAWQSHPVAYSLPMASLHEQQSCCWIADKAAPLEAEYSWRSGRIPTVRYSFSGTCLWPPQSRQVLQPGQRRAGGALSALEW
jgi:hypothetical protein